MLEKSINGDANLSLSEFSQQPVALDQSIFNLQKSYFQHN